MGHVVALRRFGFKAAAPLFIPGIGAVIRLKQHPPDPHEDAAIGLAGPVYGLGAALTSAGLWAATRQPIFGAIATVGALINLFNLLPVWTLDGGRAFRALSRNQRWITAIAAGAAWYMVRDGIVPLLVIVIVGRTLVDKEPGPGDQRATIQFVLLILLLALLYWGLQPIVARSI
jgi:Zn-dependent protease